MGQRLLHIRIDNFKLTVQNRYLCKFMKTKLFTD